MKIKKFIKEYPVELLFLIGSFAFALAGDLLYGGVEGAEMSLVGGVMAQTSGLFFSVFLILVLTRIVFKLFISKPLYDGLRYFEYKAEEEAKAKKKEKKK